MMEVHPTEFILIDQVMNELKNVMLKIESLRADLERMIAQRDQLEVEIRDLQENMKREMANRDAEIDRLKNELQRETAEQKATADLLLNSFSQIQNMMNVVKQNMNLPDSKK
jgi:predicted RNase H-like nuclease (RuvC/YqgF family)